MIYSERNYYKNNDNNNDMMMIILHYDTLQSMCIYTCIYVIQISLLQSLIHQFMTNKLSDMDHMRALSIQPSSVFDC